MQSQKECNDGDMKFKRKKEGVILFKYIHRLITWCLIIDLLAPLEDRASGSPVFITPSAFQSACHPVESLFTKWING